MFVSGADFGCLARMYKSTTVYRYSTGTRLPVLYTSYAKVPRVTGRSMG